MPKGVYEHSHMIGKNNHQWKGENAGYTSKHLRIKRLLGKPMTCWQCKIQNLPTKQYHWANISGKYKRDISDWKRLCVKCHKTFDKNRIAKGERVHTARLNKNDVISIRHMYIPRKYSYEKIAKQFKVGKSTIYHIIKNHSWRHIK